ncbi:hypothetical protein CAPTEDRAFT_217542 [Capitella teleta]|uniref:Uncharacterized protein n=1 Tax=Capitella teleta TaxID=283909 RepID=R7TCV3_CAPTE|nr:hypothetical protein CAPTEDRAFT_217542 [Capitella teleta]|eukprot:ELT91297.1 hypothetical protein CAPTEDRAFT_217542 [Capitella teleta]
MILLVLVVLILQTSFCEGAECTRNFTTQSKISLDANQLLFVRSASFVGQLAILLEDSTLILTLFFPSNTMIQVGDGPTVGGLNIPSSFWVALIDDKIKFGGGTVVGNSVIDEGTVPSGNISYVEVVPTGWLAVK